MRNPCKLSLLALCVIFFAPLTVGAQQRTRAGERVAQQPTGGVRQANASGPAQPTTRPLALSAPFQLTPQEQKFLDQILAAWEEKSSKVTTFTCTFMRWEYDLTFGPRTNDYVRAQATGEIKYKSPDQGIFQVLKMQQWEAGAAEGEPGHFTKVADAELDHWECDGKAMYEFVPKLKQLRVHTLPEELRGKAIINGPLPFIFGAKAETLKRRYFMRDITPREAVGKQIWLEAYPKTQADAANFQRVEFILSDPSFQPFGLQVYLPNGKDRTAYAFENIAINSKSLLDFFKRDFGPPRTPLGWTRVVDPPEGAPATARPPGDAGSKRQAVRPPVSIRRR